MSASEIIRQLQPAVDCFASFVDGEIFYWSVSISCEGVVGLDVKVRPKDKRRRIKDVSWTAESFEELVADIQETGRLTARSYNIETEAVAKQLYCDDIIRVVDSLDLPDDDRAKVLGGLEVSKPKKKKGKYG